MPPAMVGTSDGAVVYNGLVEGQDHNYYGTTFYGGTYGAGTIFRVSPITGAVDTVWSFGQMVTDPANPVSALIKGIDGNLYGTTFYGGIPSTSYSGTFGAGTIFKFDGVNVESLYSFSGGADGANPWGSLLQVADGSFYGTTIYSGSSDNGTIFKLDSGGLTTLYQFTGGADGGNPFATLILGADGSLYGTTVAGGTADNGTIFKYDGAGLTTLYRFNGVLDGGSPFGALVQTADGSFYGTTPYGGVIPLPAGSIAIPAPTSAPSVDDTPQGNSTLSYPVGASVNEVYTYSTAANSGDLTKETAASPASSYLATDSGDGTANAAMLTIPMSSNPAVTWVRLWRQVDGGGYYFVQSTQNVPDTDWVALEGASAADGTIFKFAGGSLTTLHVFTGGADGVNPFAGLIKGTDGKFYGTTVFGGNATSAGTAYSCAPGGAGCDVSDGSLTTLFSFSVLDGLGPFAGLFEGAGLIFYGTAEYGGARGKGSVFKLSPKAVSAVVVTGGSFVYDGLTHAAAASASSTSTPSLPVTVTYNGSPLLPVTVGTYNVVATFPGDTFNLASSAIAPIFITKAPSTVALNNETFTYDGLPHAATASASGGAIGVLLSPVTVTYNGLSAAPITAGTYAVHAAFAGDANNFGSFADATLTINKATPTITWATPSAITYGTALSATQLNATASVAGTFVYSPAAGNVPTVGAQTLSVTFTPTDTTNYTIATQTVTLTVNKATPTITWNTPAPVTYGTALSATQLNATASVSGTFAYSPDAPTVLPAGAQPLSVTFTPTDTANYTNATKTVTLTVNKATPTITWATPSAITYGTALSATQLNATASVAGTFAYSPVAGTVLSAGAQTLSVTFTPDDTANYTNATKTVTQTVNKATPTVTWATPAAITYGTPLTATQLNATASVAGAFSYSPAAGAVLPAGTPTLSVVFTPSDSTNYATATQTVTLTVNKATPTVTWATPAAITFGTALGTAQLNATASVPGTFVYSPAAGSVLGVGPQTLSVTFTPTDAIDYTNATQTVTLTVNSATPTILWAAPAAITYGTALSGAQLNATALVAGTFVYSPAAGTVPPAGTQTLSVTFTPADTASYTTATKTVLLTVSKATPTITWANPADISYGTALSATQLNATTSVPGSSAYSPAAGTVLSVGPQTLSVTFTPADTTNYNNATKTVALTVGKAVPTVAVTGGVFIYDGLPHAATATATGIGGILLAPVTITYNGSALIPVGAGTYTVVATFAGDATYGSASATATIVISPVPLTVKANNTSRNYGVANPGFTAAYTGFVNGETSAVLQGTLTFTTTATTTSLPGTYPITPAGLFSTNYTITFVAGVLTVLDVPPTAVNDSISTLPNVAVTIPVLANDLHPVGGLTITAVTTPAHGSAVIAGSAIVYTPATGFSGSDTFTYTISDGFGGTSTGTVTVIVGGIGRFVVLSDDFTWLREGTIVTKGDIGANVRRQRVHGHGADFDDGDTDDITVRIGPGAIMQDALSRVVGDTVALSPRSSIYGLVDNFLINRGGTILGPRVDTMQVPFVLKPAFPAIVTGHTNVTVAKNKTQTLAPGSYGKVRVSGGATLTLSGGLYQFESLDVDQSATVLFAAAVEIRIDGDLDTDSNSKMIVGPGVRASQVVIYVAGDDGKGNNRPTDSLDGDAGGKTVVNIGENAVVQANIYAKDGSVWLKSKVQATGSFIGHHVRVGTGARLTLDSAF